MKHIPVIAYVLAAVNGRTRGAVGEIKPTPGDWSEPVKKRSNFSLNAHGTFIQPHGYVYYFFLLLVFKKYRKGCTPCWARRLYPPIKRPIWDLNIFAATARLNQTRFGVLRVVVVVAAVVLGGLKSEDTLFSRTLAMLREHVFLSARGSRGRFNHSGVKQLHFCSEPITDNYNNDAWRMSGAW